MISHLYQLIPDFDLQRVFVDPWTRDLAFYAPVLVMGFLVMTACGWVGTFLVWRRMALVGDAISHSVLPGIVIAFLISGSRATLPMFIGAIIAGVVSSLLIDAIHRRSRVKVDAALGITFTTLFAIGVILITVFADNVDLDADCVLYGEITFLSLYPNVVFLGLPLGPEQVVRMGLVTIAVGGAIVAFYKELQITSFDPGLAHALGVNPRVVHHALMAAVSICVVSAFESVGSILVIGALIIPGVTASLLSDRLWVILAIVPGIGAASTVLGLHASVLLNASPGAAIIAAASALFVAAWVLSPSRGLVRQWLRRRGNASAALRPAPVGTG
jgi:manganese/zinc/iron transport system permease protein